MSTQNPQTPVYAKTIPKNGCGPIRLNNFYIPSFADQIKDVEVTTDDPQITIIDNSNDSKHSFAIDFTPQIDLAGTLNMVLKKASVIVPNPVLKGDTIDEVNLTWTWNKGVQNQTLVSSDGGITDPTLLSTDTSYDYTSESITDDTSFTLSGDDGKSLEGSTADLVQNLQFGNYYFNGHAANQIGNSAASLQALLDGFANKPIATSKTRNLFATGEEDEHFIFAYPASFGLATEIKKGLFVGGYVRLANVGGTLKAFETGDSETDINISNGLISEPYYVYMSLLDDQNDATEPVEIS